MSNWDVASLKHYQKFNKEDLEKAIKSMFSEEDLRLYKSLGGALYELPGGIICNEHGLKKYLEELKNETYKF